MANALTIWDRFCSIVEDHGPPRLALAAALEAAANRVISPVLPPCEDFDEYAHGFLAAHVKYRAELLAIAAELRGNARWGQDQQKQED